MSEITDTQRDLIRDLVREDLCSLIEDVLVKRLSLYAAEAKLYLAKKRPSPRSENSFERMFHAAVAQIAEISVALGIDDDEASCANGNELILVRIAQLKGEYCEACEGTNCTAKQGCVACSHPVELDREKGG